MSTLGQAIAYSASNRVIFLNQLAHNHVNGVFQQHPSFAQVCASRSHGKLFGNDGFMAQRIFGIVGENIKLE
jgi:hypothetical protein